MSPRVLNISEISVSTKKETPNGVSTAGTFELTLGLLTQVTVIVPVKVISR